QGDVRRRRVRAAAARLPLLGPVRGRSLLPRRRPRRPGHPARAAAGRRAEGVRGDRQDPARCAEGGVGAPLIVKNIRHGAPCRIFFPPKGTSAMRISVPTEVKNHEYRVAVTPAGVHELVKRGHEVTVQRGAGEGSHIPDDEYLAAGAKIRDSADEVWAEAEMVLKVKEPIAEEYHRLREDLVLFTYLHLAASRSCTDALLSAGTTAIAYETVQVNGALPLLAPMSEVAGRLAPQVGAYNLMRFNGGRGMLPGGVPGVAPARVVVIGGGVSGLNAAQIAVA